MCEPRSEEDIRIHGTVWPKKSVQNVVERIEETDITETV
jgi:hypothetical protein